MFALIQSMLVPKRYLQLKICPTFMVWELLATARFECSPCSQIMLLLLLTTFFPSKRRVLTKIAQ